MFVFLRVLGLSLYYFIWLCFFWLIRFVLVKIFRCLEIVVSDILNGFVILVMVMLFFSSIVRIVL